MNTKTLIHTFAAILAIGTASAAMASAGTPSSSDKPEVKVLFRHTAENPYDVRLLSWCGGFASRVEVVPFTSRTLVIAWNTGELHGAKITGAAPSRIGFRICKDGKTTVLFDLLSPVKRENLLPNLATKLSSIAEWKVALNLQNSGQQLNEKTFARTTGPRDQYAFSTALIQPAL